MNPSTWFRLKHLGKPPVREGLREYAVRRMVPAERGGRNWETTVVLARDAGHASQMAEVFAGEHDCFVTVKATGETLAMRREGFAYPWKVHRSSITGLEPA